MLKDLILKNRSYRRFDQTIQIDNEDLREWIDLARLSPFAGNLQSIKYLVFNDKEKNDVIFSHIGWAAYLPGNEGTPQEGEKPSAYIVLLNDVHIAKEGGENAGIASQSILLGAVEQGYGGCILKNVKRAELKEKLEISDHLEIVWVIALGKPMEKIVIEKTDKTTDDKNNIKYWRTGDQTHHLPKRDLNEIVLN